MKKKVFIFLFDGFSDWEIAFLTPEIHKSEEFELVYFSKDGKAVCSMGGLQVVPNRALSAVDLEEIELLLLPGGAAWEKGEHKELEPLTKAVSAIKKPIAAICAATTFLGQLGLLDTVNHTSSDLNYLKGVAQKYQGEEHYQNALAVSAENIITANGIAPIEFAREVFGLLGLYDAVDLEKWFQLFKNGIWAE